jgi:hypothetical protein
MLDGLRRAEVVPAERLDSLPHEVVARGRPAVLRGAVGDWPLVRAALSSDEAAVDYLDSLYNGTPVTTIVGPSSERGRFFYRDDSKEMNFERSSALLSNLLAGLLQQKDSDRPLGIAAQAILAAECLPGLEEANPNRFVPKGTPARVWIGNRVTVAPHFDVADNIACVVAGRRRFIVFPPEQTANLYPGPMDVTPANVPISMVSLDEPELDRFPRFRQALSEAFVADLEPGDAIYIPDLWWHGVQSLERFNVLVNYWFNRDESSARYPYVGFLRLAHALFGDMPQQHREAWRALYDHYVFQTGGDPMDALSARHRDRPGEIDVDGIARLKQLLRELLDRS